MTVGCAKCGFQALAASGRVMTVQVENGIVKELVLDDKGVRHSFTEEEYAAKKIVTVLDQEAAKDMLFSGMPKRLSCLHPTSEGAFRPESLHALERDGTQVALLQVQGPNLRNDHTVLAAGTVVTMERGGCFVVDGRMFALSRLTSDLVIVPIDFVKKWLR